MKKKRHTPEEIIKKLREAEGLIAKEKRAGYRTVWRHLRRNGCEVNSKRVHRIWKREGLRLPPQIA